MPRKYTIRNRDKRGRLKRFIPYSDIKSKVCKICKKEKEIKDFYYRRDIKCWRPVCISCYIERPEKIDYYKQLLEEIENGW